MNEIKPPKKPLVPRIPGHHVDTDEEHDAFAKENAILQESSVQKIAIDLSVAFYHREGFRRMTNIVPLLAAGFLSVVPQTAILGQAIFQAYKEATKKRVADGKPKGLWAILLDLWEWLKAKFSAK